MLINLVFHKKFKTHKIKVLWIDWVKQEITRRFNMEMRIIVVKKRSYLED